MYNKGGDDLIMKNQYTIKELATACKVSTQSIYNLKDKNKEFFKQNSKRNQRTIYYNQAVLNFLLDYYHLDKDSPDSENILYEKIGGGFAPQEGENSSVLTSSPDELSESRIKEYESQIDALKAENERLKKELDAKEEERKELLKQNGALILALSQEKQEKMLLLPAPKKPFGERVKSLFHKESKA